MTEEIESLERRIAGLQAAVRGAVSGGDRERARALRGELRRAQAEWDEAVERLDEEAPPAPPAPPAAAAGPLLPIREQVHQALTLLGGPAAPRLILTVHRAFFAGQLVPARLTSIRRDEERSFRAAPHARAYYLCAALTADRLAPARGLLAVSTWPLDRRVIGPLSPRVLYLTAAIRVADTLRRLPHASPDAYRLLWRFAANIPGAPSGTSPDPAEVADAAQAELAVHEPEDATHRLAAAARARAQLDDAGQLFGTTIRISPVSRAGS